MPLVVGTDIGVVRPIGEGINNLVLSSDKVKNTIVALSEIKKNLAEAKNDIAKKYGDLLSYNDKYFISHAAEIQKRASELADKAADMMSRGIDPYGSFNSDEVKQFYKEANELKQMANTSASVASLYTKYSDILYGDDNNKIKNKDEILAWFSQPIDKIYESGGVPPAPIFEQPNIDLYSYKQAIKKKWNESNNRPPTDDDIIGVTADVLASEEKSTKLFVQRNRQIYDALDEEVKKKYSTIGSNMGFTDGFQYFMYKTLSDVMVANSLDVDLKNIMNSVEGKVVTEKQYNEWTSYLLAGRQGAIMADVANGLYGDINKSIEENIKDAFAYYKSLLKSITVKRYTPRTSSSSSSQKIDVYTKYGGDSWYSDITSRNPNRVMSALNYLGPEGIESMIKERMANFHEIRKWSVNDDGNIVITINHKSMTAEERERYGIRDDEYVKDINIILDINDANSGIDRNRLVNSFNVIANKVKNKYNFVGTAVESDFGSEKTIDFIYK